MRRAEQGLRADQRFQAAAVAADAERAIGLDRHVTELAGGSGGAPIRRAVQHHAQADALADGGEQEVGLVRAGAVEAFGGGDRADVVVDEHRHAERRAQSRGQRQAGPAQAYRHAQRARLRLHDPRHRHPDAGQRQAAALDLVDLRADQGDESLERVRGRRVEGVPETVHDLGVKPRRHAGDVLVRDLHPDRVRRFRDQGQRDRGPSATAGRGPRCLLDQQALGEQPPGALGDRRGAQLQQVGDLRAAERTAPGQQRQHGGARHVPADQPAPHRISTAFFAGRPRATSPAVADAPMGKS